MTLKLETLANLTTLKRERNIKRPINTTKNPQVAEAWTERNEISIRYPANIQLNFTAIPKKFKVKLLLRERSCMIVNLVPIVVTRPFLA